MDRHKMMNTPPAGSAPKMTALMCLPFLLFVTVIGLVTGCGTESTPDSDVQLDVQLGLDAGLPASTSTTPVTSTTVLTTTTTISVPEGFTGLTTPTLGPTTTTTSTTTVPPTTTTTLPRIAFHVVGVDGSESAFDNDPWMRIELQWFMPYDTTGSIAGKGPFSVEEVEAINAGDLAFWDDGELDAITRGDLFDEYGNALTSIILSDIEHTGGHELEITDYGHYAYVLFPMSNETGLPISVSDSSTLVQRFEFGPPPPSNDLERAWHQIARVFPEFGTWPNIRLLPDVEVEYRSNKCGLGAEACVDRDELAAGQYTIYFSKSFTPSAYYHEVAHIIHYLAWPEESRTGATPEAISSWHEICEVGDHKYEYYCDSWEEWVAVAFEDSVKSGRIKGRRCGGSPSFICVGTGVTTGVEEAVEAVLGDF